MANIDRAKIETFLTAVGSQCEPRSTLFLLGGGAIALLNSERPTVDLDYAGHDLQTDSLQQLMAQVATDMHIELEAVPIDEFVPLPENAADRAIFVGQFGNLSVYIFDPYTIALSKIDRGFETDLDDIVFLIRNGIITLQQLEAFVEAAMPQAFRFDLDPAGMRRHLEIVGQLL